MKGASFLRRLRELCTLLIIKLTCVPAYARQVPYEDIYEGEFRGGGGLIGAIVVSIIIILFFWGIFSNKDFRHGLLWYAAPLAGIFFLFVVFGKEVGIVACIVVFFLPFLKNQIKEHDDKSALGTHSSAPEKSDLSDVKPILKINGEPGSVAAREKGKPIWTLESSGLRKGSAFIPLDFLSVPQGGGERLAIDAKSGYPPFIICFDNLKTDIEWTQLIEILSRREKIAPDPERVVRCSGCGVHTQLKDYLPSPLGEGGVKCPLCKMNFQISSKS